MARWTAARERALALLGGAVRPDGAARGWAVVLNLALVALLVAGAATVSVAADYDLVTEPVLPGWLVTALEVVASVSLLVRAWAPVPVLVLTVVATTVLEGSGAGGDAAAVAVLFALAGMAARCPLRTSAPALGLTVLSVPVGLAATRVQGLADATSVPEALLITVFAALVLVGCWAIGRSLWARREQVAALQERAGRLERDRAEQQERAVATERLRIARELPDVVGHHLSVMTVQTAAGRRRLPDDPDRATEALLVAERTGRAAMQELRRVVGVLREPGDPAADEELQPQPGLARLDGLLDAARHRGLRVQLAVTGESSDLAAGVDLTAYRLIQEGLTNVSKHAGPTAVRVSLDWTEDALDLAVVDDGGPVPVPAHRLDGHGLLGMRERVAMLGGHLEVGPRGVRGFRVRACLPLDRA